MGLQSDGMDLLLVESNMDDCGNSLPTTLNSIFQEVLVEGNSRIAFNVYVPISAFLAEDHGADHATIRLNGLLEAVEAHLASAVVVRSSTQSHEDLLCTVGRRQMF